MHTDDGRRRVIIEGVAPEIDGGRSPIKRTIGEDVTVTADMFTDGHDALSCVLLYRPESEQEWSEVQMKALVNDRWRGAFKVERFEQYCYSLIAWIDHFKSWSRDLEKRIAAGQDISVDRQIGAQRVEEAATRASGSDATALTTYAGLLRDGSEDIDIALNPALTALMYKHSDRDYATRYDKELAVTVERERARFSAWYELFPRSLTTETGGHGTFKDVEAHLPTVKAMGFDVLYLPPIHPIGHTFRKGKNNNVVAQSDEPGSPWAIGSAEGGHKSIHSELGTLEDFRQLVDSARSQGIDIALDIAFQCSPDHPYVQEHPEWFKHRPDGSIQYAENPPKKYQDIYPFNFETDNWRELWDELNSVFMYWCEQGVRVFRVDNPHTKPFPFWEWTITEVKKVYPDTIFLSEAFTRPRVLYRLAKLGFTQSYNYFAWRNTRSELTEYLTELTTTEVAEYCRPNLWPNTPDILPESLQVGGRPAFISRLVLAATLGASYGIYGPAYELMDNTPLEYGREEYFDSEKYEIKQWNTDRPDSLREIVTLVNRARHQNPALQSNERLVFHPTGNDQLIAYSKTTADKTNTILAVVNLDPHHTQSGWVDLPLEDLGIEPNQPFQMHDLIGGARYLWNGPANFVELNPHAIPAHIFRVRHRVRTEHDFDYFI
ncbi:alpha-1,4-glucan--maltose-1-phosphate maltosyltransferase [soil metagenome]